MTPVLLVVGLQQLFAADASRPLPDGPPRPVPVVVWYRTDGETGRQITWGDVIGLSAGSGRAAPSKDEAARAAAGYRSFLVGAKVEEAEASGLMRSPMNAVRDAPPAKGKAPIVLIAQGNGDGPEAQAFLAERLASHGYVVATTTSPTRLFGPMKSEADIAPVAADQARDLAVALKEVEKLLFADGRRIGVIGHSFGARAALLFTMSEPRTQALVSLDGGIGVATGEDVLPAARGWDPKKAAIPILHIYEDVEPFMAPDFDLLGSLSGARVWLVKVDGLRHVHFTSVGHLMRGSSSLAKATSADESSGRAIEAVDRLVLALLDEFVARKRGPKWPPSDAAFPVRPLRSTSFAPK